MKTDTGHKDRNLEPIYVGDRFLLKEHSGECCNHRVSCVVEWNAEWNQYGLKSANGDWITNITIMAGEAKQR